MALNSAGFVLFAALVILVHRLIPERARWVFLLVCSAAFYVSGGVLGFIYPLSATAATWLAARSLDRAREKRAELTKDEKAASKKAYDRRRRATVLFCVLFDLAALAFGKYVSGIVLRDTPAGGLGLIFPLGISFFTLSSIGYLVDVYRGTVKAERNPFRLALFVSYFPAVSQGPICRFGELEKELFAPRGSDEKALFRGVMRMLWGYFKKAVVADRIGVAVESITGSPELRGAYVIVLLLFYTVRLYADFTGGIDVALGFSEALGIKLPENFNLPYFSGSLKEYWRRWHITMCSWFRDYVFYPVSTSAVMTKISRAVRNRSGRKAARRCTLWLSAFTVWLLTGLWHGVGLNFVVWGLLNWLILMTSEELEPLYARFHEKAKFSAALPYRVFRVIRTFLLICVLNLFDCFERVGDTLGALFSVFSAGNGAVLFDGSLLKLGLTGTDYIILGAGVALMLAVSLVRRKRDIREELSRSPYALRLSALICLAVFTVIFGAYGIGYDASSFIYGGF